MPIIITLPKCVVNTHVCAVIVLEIRNTKKGEHVIAMCVFGTYAYIPCNRV